ncbi:MAG: PQQ-dependent sugar dehydrogenase [Acidiferrobacterales bacterium]|nr:PQQ-dependent sugar dehydrogenase [Acidiferrobacterales bacterium]
MPIKILILIQTFIAVFLLSIFTHSAFAVEYQLPSNFSDTPVLENLQDTDGFAFGPDGRLFISKPLTGKLRVANYNANTDCWELNATPFYTFDIPKDGGGNPEAVGSAGLRDMAFDPDFVNNGYAYAYYMNDTTRHNRVVRITQSSANSDIADSTFGEQLLMDLSFNDNESSGSHNGGNKIW